MRLDEVRQAKERGRRVIMQPGVDATVPDASEAAFHVLLTPSSSPVAVGGKEGYGVLWGNYTKQEACVRLPDEL